ncbi:MAG: hypothetical protein GJ680_18255 [Alteromonadaceae bacterium]|nr:hypothetical protein [Alteromonadaceae bacterium]
MKLLPALFFVGAGIWISVNKPEWAAMAYVYIELAINWALNVLAQAQTQGG